MDYSKVEIFEFYAEPFQVDFTGHLTLSVLGNHMLNCAGIHADHRGFGIGELNENNYTWVLSRMVFEMDHLPCQNEKFYIETWVESVNKLFTNRNFAILDKDKKAIGYTRSTWAMIDLDTRRPVNLLDMHEGNICNYVLPEKECPIEGPSRIKVNADSPVQSIRAKYSDIDINQHFNSIRYIEHILDLFPLDKFGKSHLHRFEIAFINESLFGDTLELYLESASENNYSVEVKNATTSEVVCRSAITFN